MQRRDFLRSLSVSPAAYYLAKWGLPSKPEPVGWAMTMTFPVDGSKGENSFRWLYAEDTEKAEWYSYTFNVKWAD